MLWKPSVDLDALLAALLADRSGLTREMVRVFRIALRDGAAVAGAGSHAGRVERVRASTIVALIRRGLLTYRYGSEGNMGGALSVAMVDERDRLIATAAQ